MKVIGFIGAVFTFVFFANLAYAADMSIDMLNKDADGNRMVYSNELAKVAVGDTITWLPASKGHNVEIVAAPEGYEIPKKSKFNKEVTLGFSVPGVYYYICTPHKAMGMIGLIVVGGDTSNKEEIAKVKALGKSKKKLKKLIEDLTNQ